MNILQQLSEKFIVKGDKVYGDEQEIKDFLSQFGDAVLQGAKGHKSIEAQSDHNLSIEDDLGRRDFTFNAMAVDRDMLLIDPFNGLEDLNNRVVRCISEETFADDPLRMMRAIQFAARFNFLIEAVTCLEIIKNKSLINDITSERVIEELSKVFEKKGNIPCLTFYLSYTGIFEQYFGLPLIVKRLDPTQFLSELLHFGIADTVMDTAQFYKKKLGSALSNDLLKELKAFNTVYNTFADLDKTVFHIMFDAIKQSDIVLKSGFIGDAFKQPFLDKEFPSYRSEMAVTGDDLIALGIPEGALMGLIIKKMLDGIFTRKLKNTREDLMTIVNENNCTGLRNTEEARCYKINYK